MIKNLEEIDNNWWIYSPKSCSIKDMQHKTIKAIHREDNERLWFLTIDNYLFLMYHEQDCCESVEIEDICGDLEDLIDTPIIIAEERTEEGDGSTWESSTWTFYELQTLKGDVTIRWYGTSNGYYSETADMYFFSPEDVLRAGVTCQE